MQVIENKAGSSGPLAQRKSRQVRGFCSHWWLAVLLAVIVSGCVKATIEPRPKEGKATLTFDWGSNAKPGKVQVWLYGQDGNKTDMKECPNADKIEITLPAGKYKALAVNCDAPEIAYRNMDRYQTAEAYLITTRVCVQVVQPSLVYTAQADLEIAGQDSVAYALIPVSHVKAMRLNLDFTGNIELIESCSAVIEGVSTGINLSQGGILSGGNGSHTASLSRADTRYQATVNLLGKDVDNVGSIVIEIAYKDGNTQSLRLDIDDELSAINTSGTVSVAIALTMEQIGAWASVTGWDIVPGGDMDMERPGRI